MSKLVASRVWVCAFWFVPILAIIAIALPVHSPANGSRAAGSVSAASVASRQRADTPAARSRIQANYAALPLAFEQNHGQTDSQVQYMARGNGYVLFLTANNAVFSLQSRAAKSATASLSHGIELHAENQGQRSAQEDLTAVVRMQLEGGNALVKISASGQLPGKISYFLGNDSSKWRADVPHYARVSYKDVYPGVNLVFHGAQRQTEFDFVVAPEANPAPIAFHFTGAEGIQTDRSGNLVISSAAGEVLLRKPVAYQEQRGARQPVDARFVLKANNQVSFELGNYDRSRELVIDPSVSYAYSTYLGGSGADEGQAIAFDGAGAAYVTGRTASTNFPGVSGTLNNAASAFVTKIAPDGSSLDFSVYVGGNGTGSDIGNAIKVDASGNAFVAGSTTSTNFPHTSGAFQTTLKGAGNAFVFKLDPSGTLTFGTYLGGTGTDTALGIALARDGSGDVFVVGRTSSLDFPISPTPLQGFLTGSTFSGFVTKLNSSGTALVYSTYLGGSGSSIGDVAGAVAVDSSDNAYITGQTFSPAFHTTAGVFQPACGSCSGGKSNAFVTVINPLGSAYVYSTFLGGPGVDAGHGIAVDSAGNAYITGSTTSSPFPTTAGALQTIYGGNTDAFVTKLNPAGTALVYSTYLGGSGTDTGASIAVDGGNNAYVTGQTNSTATNPFPTVGATQPTLGGGFDAFVSEINSTGSTLIFSTYLGGSANEDDTGNFGAIAVDIVGANIYVTGNTASATDFPHANAIQAVNGGGSDAFVVKYAQPAFSLSATTPSSVVHGGSSTSTITLTPLNGYSSSVTLTCTVIGPGTPLPGCNATSFSPNPVTVNFGATSLLTLTTSGGPTNSVSRPRNLLYAVWMPIACLALMGIGFSSSRSRGNKMLGILMLGMVPLFMIAGCGSGVGGGNTCGAAPSVPTGLAASGTTSTGTTLNWTASTAGANCSVTGYQVFQNGNATPIGTPANTTFNVTGLAPSTMYTFTVAASDSFGTSAKSSPPLPVTTAAGATPAGNYTITITATDTNGRSQSTQVTLTVT